MQLGTRFGDDWRQYARARSQEETSLEAVAFGGAPGKRPQPDGLCLCECECDCACVCPCGCECDCSSEVSQ
jgi:hypothetical protein